jgi:hypothetical protein
MTRRKNNTLSNAIAGIGASARKKAFRNKLPVAISENGKTILVYPDGTRKPFTKEAFQELQHAHA